jgi:hypothetical protein
MSRAFRLGEDDLQQLVARTRGVSASIGGRANAPAAAATPGPASAPAPKKAARAASPARAPAPMKVSEDELQISCFEWIELMRPAHPIRQAQGDGCKTRRLGCPLAAALQRLVRACRGDEGGEEHDHRAAGRLAAGHGRIGLLHRGVLYPRGIHEPCEPLPGLDQPSFSQPGIDEPIRLSRRSAIACGSVRRGQLGPLKNIARSRKFLTKTGCMVPASVVHCL